LADPSTLDLLGRLIDQAPTVPLLIVLTFRPEFAPPWATRSHARPLTLSRLDRPQIEVLATRLAGGKALPAEVVEHVVQKTDGVPLFVEEMTKAVLGSSVLRANGDRYSLTGPLSEISIPGEPARISDGAARPAADIARGGAVGRRIGPRVRL
jgi:predicted ATPase